MKVAVIGSGKMGNAYRQAVTHCHMEVFFDFYKKNDASKIIGCFRDWLPLDRGLILQKYDVILLAIPVDQYVDMIEWLGRYTDCFLLEKPGFSNMNSYASLSRWVQSHHKKIFVLFNRRFFSSVRYLKSKLECADQFNLRVCFDDRISSLSKFTRPWELRYWVWFNSAHMIDLAFWLLGSTIENSDQIVFESKLESAKEIDWHEGSSNMRASFCAGKIELLLEADWTRDGSWAIDGNIDGQPFDMSPIERFVSEDYFVTETDLDSCKPGLGRIVENIVNMNYSDFATIEYCRELYERICKIGNY